ncbi:hypothetical protein WJ0W_006221 [Paenibacillus melissococcoides]|uniref:Phage protein n=1 Tax=Paenibacillus melissococcoides TaxID=2912268 RepID=A0ABM9GBJ4_9BACL|nr:MULTISPECIES: hypothetical protein [Paenibacillus]GIO82381.1 hypothetical protein J6TS7_59910 [Paenibacillus dendritiformis]CAH8249034.1 hypothetical protein WJ0W_006221 [Paenibacillus melissococcoides]
MAKIQPIIQVEIDPTKPVPEICAVISAVVPYQPEHEEAILMGINEAIGKRLAQLRKKGEANGK